MIDDTHVYLKEAILKKAVADYKKALEYNDKSKIFSLERFFKSEWGEFLSNNNGSYIIENVQKEFEKEERNKNYV